MKKIIFIVLLMFVVSCGKGPEQTIDEFFGYIQNGNSEKALDSLMDADVYKNKLILDKKNNYKIKIFNEALKNLSYDVSSLDYNEKKDIAFANVHIKSIDLNKVLENSYVDIAKYTLNLIDGEDKKVKYDELQENISNILISKLHNGGIEYKTTDVEMKLQKDNRNKWKIVGNDELFNSILTSDLDIEFVDYPIEK